MDQQGKNIARVAVGLATLVGAALHDTLGWVAVGFFTGLWFLATFLDRNGRFDK